MRMDERNPLPLRCVALALTIAALSFACSNSSASPPPDFPRVLSHSATVDENNGLIAFVRVVLSSPARAAVEYENEFAGKYRTAWSERATEHVIPVARLRADTAYRYAAVVETGERTLAYGAAGEFVSGAIPDGLSGVDFIASGESSAALIARDLRVSISQSPDREPPYIVMHDALGYVVWAYQAVEPGVESDIHAIRFKPDGNIMYLISERHIREITPLGEFADEIASGPDADAPHHDFLLLDDGRVLYIGGYETVFDDSANGGDAETPLEVDALNIYDPATGEIARVWDAMDFWDVSDPAQRKRGFNRSVPKWTHMNSVAESPEGGYIVSFRNLDQVASISADFQTVRWRLGGPGGDFDFPNPRDVFQTQHTAALFPNGNVLLFDNRVPAPDGGHYSRALELSLDFETKTAVEAWSFSPEPPIHSRIKCSAYRMDNGNTLAAFVWSDEGAPSTIIEADPSGREVFRLEAKAHPNLFADSYRAYPAPDSIMGETMLRPPKR